MSGPTTTYIALGSNQGEKEGFIKKALTMLAEAEQVEVVGVSDIRETRPLGGSNQPNYLNAVAEIKTTLTAKSLHKVTADIETSLGRSRGEKWSPRTIDLDLLLFGDDIVKLPDLTVPHPQMHLRSFVLGGLCQLNSGLIHPVLKEPMSELAARLNGGDFVIAPNLPQLVSVAGIIGVGKTTLVKKLSSVPGWEKLFEPYDENPFMPDVYAGKKELALNSQLFFLTSRARQLDTGRLGCGRVVISDYCFDKELIYARRLLDSRQLALYEEIFPPFAAKVAKPVLVIYLTDSIANCLERIRRRNRPYEQGIKKELLEAFSSDYEELFDDWKGCPVIRLSVSEFDCTRQADVKRLAEQVVNYVAM
jgi:2-amino-4-hydroxy-6-hydroxymethyldihydropteridine diphosphokinase